MTDDSDVTLLRTFLVIGIGLAPTATGLPAERTRRQGPIASVTALRQAIAEAPSDYVAIQRTALPGTWVRDAALLIETDPRIGAVVVTGPEHARGDDLFAEAGAALVVGRHALHEVGGHLSGVTLLEGVEADLQWRLAARGYRIVALPAGPRGCFPRPLSLTCRLGLMVDNLERPTLAACLPGIVLAAVTSSLHEHGADTRALDLQRSPGGDAVGTLAVPADALAGVRDVTELSRLLPDLTDARRVALSTRRVSDRVLAPGVAAFVEVTQRQAGVSGIVADAFPLHLDDRPRLRVLLLTSFGPTGPETTWLEAVTAALTDRVDVRCRRLGVDAFDESDAAWADAVVLEGVYLRSVPWLARLDLPILVDCTRWGFADDLRADQAGLVRGAPHNGAHARPLFETASRADMFVVDGDEQRDLVLGLLAGCGRLNDLVYDEDASLRTLVDTLDPTAIALWCAAPRRAIDLVHTFVVDEQPEPGGALERVRRAAGPLRRLIPAGRQR